MKIKLYIFIVVIAYQASIKLKAQTCKEIIGYYPNWQWYDRSKLVKPTTIKYQSYSIINYCFFKPETSGLVSSTDTWADENLLQGQINWSTTPTSYYPNTSIIDLAHNAGTKVMVSIGGWTLSDNFPTIAASSATRALFASECNRLLSFYKFDGIDIDWEYPGYVDHSGTVNYKHNFTLLIQQIKDSITSLGIKKGKNYLLSACFSPDYNKMQNIEWNNIKNTLDMINVMSYDYFGAFDCAANHNSPLYSTGAGDAQFNLNSSFNTLTTTYQVPASKINLGVAFYGRSQTGASGIYQPTNCNANSVLFSEDDGTPQYYNIDKNINQFNYFWDNAAQVPYLMGKTGSSAAGTFVSYDGQKSVALKANYVKTKNARGIIIWEITGDYIETAPNSGIIGSTPLIDTINATFCVSTLGIDTQTEANAISIFPNPTKSQFTINTADLKNKVATLEIINEFGQIVLSAKIDKTAQVINTLDLKPGFYFIYLKGISTQPTKLIIAE